MKFIFYKILYYLFINSKMNKIMNMFSQATRPEPSSDPKPDPEPDPEPAPEPIPDPIPNPKPDTKTHEENTDSESDKDIKLTKFELFRKDSQILDQTNKNILCKCSYDSFIHHIDTFSYNRQISQEHVDKIYKTLDEENNNNIVLHGLMEAILTKDGSIILINGHHRREVLLKVKDKKKIMPLYINIYISDSISKNEIEEHEETMKLFEQLNNSKEFKTKDIPENIYYKCFDDLNKKYPDCITTGIKIRLPKIDKKKLYHLLKSNDIHSKYNSASKLKKMLLAINQKYSTKSINEFFDKITPTRTNQFNRAQQSKFFLGLLTEEELIEELTSEE